MKFSFCPRNRWTAVFAFLFLKMIFSSAVFGQSKGMGPAKAAKLKAKAGLFKTDGGIATGISGDTANNPVIKVFLSTKEAKKIPAIIECIAMVTEVVGPITAWDDKTRLSEESHPKMGAVDQAPETALHELSPSAFRLEPIPRPIFR
ncbi:MAG: hypothetical protein VX768_04445 [Planctomycetota bacterium]|nr:hypothetical protein [Planctomycetota bacterium]